MKNKPENSSASPRWSNTAKLIVVLLFIVICVMLVIRFEYIIAPLLAAFLLAYILQPAAAFLNKKLKVSWRLSVNLVYIIFALFLISLLIWGGSEIIKQTINLIRSLIDFVSSLPQTIAEFFSQTIVIGSWKIDLSQVDTSTLVNDLTNFATNTASKLGNLITSIGSQAFSFFGWMFFSIFISYFLLHETTSEADQMIDLDIPHYRDDIKILTHELDKVWNTFLRRQLVILVMVVVIFSAILGLLKVNGFFWLALLMAFSRYIPYIGPLVAWVAIGIITYFQGATIFGLSSLGYTILVMVIVYVVDNIVDMIIVTRMMADALQLHPAASMLAAFLMLNWIGLLGMILSAPILATLVLVVKYLWYKYNDEDPWEHIKLLPHKPRERNIQRWAKKLFMKVKGFFIKLFTHRKEELEQVKNTKDKLIKKDDLPNKRRKNDRT